MFYARFMQVRGEINPRWKDYMSIWEALEIEGRGRGKALWLWICMGVVLCDEALDWLGRVVLRINIVNHQISTHFQM